MTAWNHTVTLHNFQTHFNSRLRSWLVLNFFFPSGVKWTSNINNQALLFYFIQYRLVVLNLVVSLYFEVPQQLVSEFIHWLWIMVVVTMEWILTCTPVVAHVIHVFVIPVITQHSTYKISPTESSAPSCLPYNIDIAFGQFFAFQYHMANCLITFSAILQFTGTFCLSVVFIVLDLTAWSCAAIIISSISIFSQLPFFSVTPKSLYLLLLLCSSKTAHELYLLKVLFSFLL